MGLRVVNICQYKKKINKQTHKYGVYRKLVVTRYRGYKQIQVILIFQLLFTGSFVLITSHSSIKIPALFVTIQASQVKSSQIKSNQIKSNQIKKKISNIMSDSHLFVYLIINLF